MGCGGNLLKTATRVPKLFLVVDVEISVFDRLMKQRDHLWYPIRSHICIWLPLFNKSLIVISVKSIRAGEKTEELEDKGVK